MKKKSALMGSSLRVRRRISHPQTLTTAQGEIHFRSKFEAQVAKELIKSKAKFTYETVSYDYIISSSYTPDFILPNCVVEVKGVLTKEERKKYIAVKTQHPTLRICFCFQNANNKLSKAKRSLTYSAWAERHGFPWCNKTIPKEWYEN